MLDGVFAFVILNNKTGEIYIGRDPIGVRSLYYGKNNNGDIIISSEMKSIPPNYLVNPFPPGHFAILNYSDNGWNIENIIQFYHYNFTKQIPP